MSNYDLILNFITLVVMPLIILANLSGFGMKNPFNAYLWREHTWLMRISLVILGMITLFSAITLLGHYGYISPEMNETLSMVVGIPFMLMAFVLFYFVIRSVLKIIRDRREGRLGA